MHRHRFYLTLFLYVSVLLGGCAGRTAPAPVILLNSQVSDGSEEYTKKTLPILDYYADQRILHKIDGTRQINQIFYEIRSIFASLET